MSRVETPFSKGKRKVRLLVTVMVENSSVEHQGVSKKGISKHLHKVSVTGPMSPQDMSRSSAVATEATLFSADTVVAFSWSMR